MENILEIKNLSVAFPYGGKPVAVTKDVTFSIASGEVLGVVGESGSGKSVTAKTVMRLLPSPPSTVLEGEILLDGHPILSLSEKEMQHLRGNTLAMIFQEPMTSLNPVFTCGNQLEEAIRLHQKIPKAQARKKAIEMLDLVGIPYPEQRLNAYPHELSGGMRQRVMIAMALSCNPKLLIADEPTTALDPTIQAQIIELILRLQKERGMAVMYITHDLGVVAETCQRVIVMYAGMIMEIALVEELFDHPLHPYTKGLMKAMPKMGERREHLYDIKGTVPHVTQMPEGCRFCTRCPHVQDRCRHQCPELTDAGDGHLVRCFYYNELREVND